MKEYVNEIKQTEKYLTRITLMYDMDSGKTEFLETAYSLLGLHDNKRIIEKEKKCMKATKNMSNHIYENIIDIIVEEIYENDNMEILDHFICHYKKRFSGMASDATKYDANPELFYNSLKNNFSPFGYARNTCTMLYCLLFGKNEEIKKTIIHICEPGSTFSESAWLFLDSGKNLETKLGVGDLKSMKLYQNFLSNQRKRVTDFIGINFGKLEKFVFNQVSSCAHAGSDISEKFKFFYALRNLHDALARYGISIASIINLDEKECLDIINWNFENLCNSMLFEKYFCLMQQNQEPTLNQVILQTSIEDPQAFLTNLVLSFYFDLTARHLKDFMIESCRNFSINNRPEDAYQEQGLASENSRLKAENEKLKEKLKQQEAACQEIKRKHAKEAKKEIHGYEEQIRSLNRQLNKQKEINCGLQKQISVTGNLKQEANIKKSNCETDMNISRLFDKKILFLGGSDNLVNKLKQTFKNAYFRDKNSASFPDKVDLTVILANHIGHSLTNKFQSLNSNSIVIESHSTNVNKIVRKMLESS